MGRQADSRGSIAVIPVVHRYAWFANGIGFRVVELYYSRYKWDFLISLKENENRENVNTTVSGAIHDYKAAALAGWKISVGGQQYDMMRWMDDDNGSTLTRKSWWIVIS